MIPRGKIPPSGKQTLETNWRRVCVKNKRKYHSARKIPLKPHFYSHLSPVASENVCMGMRNVVKPAELRNCFLKLAITSSVLSLWDKVVLP